MDIHNVSFVGRWKSSAVLRYVSDALEEMPLNARAPIPVGIGQAVSFPAPSTPAPMTPMLKEGKGAASRTEEEVDLNAEAQPREVQFVKVIDKAAPQKTEREPSEPQQQKPLWAISRAGRQKTRHLVTQASWGLPLDEWSTACGWHFAKYHVKVELTRTKVTGPKECQKCQTWMKGRDKVRGGWNLAPAIQLDG